MRELLDNLWYHIPGYNGYLLNCEGQIKSYKNFEANPSGQILRQKNGSLELTDDQNRRRRVKVADLVELVKKYPSCLPIDDYHTYTGSRNRGLMNNNTEYNRLRSVSISKLNISNFSQPLVTFNPTVLKLVPKSFDTSD